MKPYFIAFTIVAILYFIFVFVTHYFYEEYLWFKSAESWVPWLQSFKWWPWKRFVRCLYWFGWEILWSFVVLFYCKFNRASSAFLIITTSELVALVSFAKMFWNDPAPYMDRKAIDAFECNQNTFQNPSLEVTLSAFAYSMMFYLAYDFIDVLRPRVQVRDKGAPRNTANNPDSVFEDQEEDYFLHENTGYQKTKENDFTFWIYLTLVIYVVFLIAYAGMYIGSQSFDQVLFAMALGYGGFCVCYFYFKDYITENYVRISEKMVPVPHILIQLALHLVWAIILLIVIRIFYSVQLDDFTVNPRWKSEHFDECGILPFPSFFDKEILYTYNFLFLAVGCIVGMVFDSLVLGGTRIDYNQLRRSEGRNPLVGFILRVLITVGWILLNVWGFTALLKMIIHHWLFVMAIPYFLCGFGLFSILKYLFQIVGATRPEIYPLREAIAVGLRKSD